MDTNRGGPPQVDIIVVTYNSAQYVGGLLESIERLSGYSNYSIVIVDNCSVDDTVAVVRKAAPHARIIANSTNRWLSPAIAQALRVTNGEYVVIANPDLRFETPDWLKLAVDHFEEHPDVGVVGPRLVDDDGRTQYTVHEHRSRRWALAQAAYLPAIGARLGIQRDWRWRPHWNRDTTTEVPVVSGACLAVSRYVLNSIGGIDERYRLYFEEDDLCRRVWSAGRTVVLLAEIEATHYWAKSTSQLDADELGELCEESFLLFFSKHEGAFFGNLLTGTRRCANWVRSARKHLRPLLEELRG
jgi:GT2 family glycosyltransferase